VVDSAAAPSARAPTQQAHWNTRAGSEPASKTTKPHASQAEVKHVPLIPLTAATKETRLRSSDKKGASHVRRALNAVHVQVADNIQRFAAEQLAILPSTPAERVEYKNKLALLNSMTVSLERLMHCKNMTRQG